MSINKSLSLLAVSIILFLAAFFRLYKSDWGEGFYFHPDENNIAGLITNLDQQSSPKFWFQGTFSYGTSLDYTIYFIEQGLNRVNLCQFSEYSCVTLLLRLAAALSSFLTVLVVFWLGSRFWGDKWGLAAAWLAAFSPGMIQAAHFGTFESILTFLYLLSFTGVFLILKEGQLKYLLVAILPIVLAGSLKINSLVLLPLPLLAYGGKTYFSSPKAEWLIKLFYGFVLSLILISLVPLFSPYYLTSDFRGMLGYERGVVTGSLAVFYTRQFAVHNNLLFPLESVYPYLTNPLLPGLVGGFLILISGKLYRWFKKRLTYFQTFTLCAEVFLASYLLALLIPNLWLFTKWSRYFVPTLPFLILGSVGFLAYLHKKVHFLAQLITVFILGLAIFQAITFFSIYQQADSRLQASRWLYQQLPNNSYILSETANVVDIPLAVPHRPDKNFTVIPFDFYNLDQDPSLPPKLYQSLARADYILIPSRRIFMNMAQHNSYPLVSRYYQLLFSGQLGFQPIATFNSYPQLTLGSIKIEMPDETAEETWTVFDHPVIRIFKKTIAKTPADYSKLISK